MSTALCTSAYPQSPYPTFVFSSGSHLVTPESAMMYPSRQLEVSLVRRELQLNQEIENLRIEEKANERRQELEQQHREEWLARERLITSAREIEKERAKRLEEQQDRLMQKERALEDYKAQMAKEVEAAKERRVAAQEKREELLFQHELQRIKVECEEKIAAKNACEKNHYELVEKQISQLQKEVHTQFQKELQKHEQESREALQRQAQKWEKRFANLEIEREDSLALLQLQREKDADELVNSQRQVLEANEEISRLKSEVEAIQKALLNGRGDEEDNPESTGRSSSGSSMALQHRRSVQQLQEIFEEDKRRSRRQFIEEVERLKAEMNRRMDELRDHHRIQIRCKEEELISTQRRLEDAQNSLAEERAKTAVNNHSGNEYFIQEEARLKEELRTFRIKNQELEENNSKSLRRQHEQEVQIGQQAKTIQTLQQEIHHQWKKHSEELNNLRDENRQLRHALQTEKNERATESMSLRSQLHSAQQQQALMKTAAEMEETLQSLSSAKENYEKHWEDEKEQLEKKIRASEEELQCVKQRESTLERQLEAAKQQENQIERQRLAALDSARREKEKTTKSVEILESQLRETTARLQRAEQELRVERQEQERWKSTVLEPKVRELERLQRELEEHQREISDLRNTKMTLSISQEAEKQRSLRLLTEMEGGVSMRQREVEELQLQVAQRQRKIEDLERRLESATATYQQVVCEKEESISSLQTRLMEITEERVRIERELRRLEEHQLLAKQSAAAQKELLEKKNSYIARLEDEARQQKRESNAQKSTLEELRARLEQANETIRTLSCGSSHSHRTAKAKAVSSAEENHSSKSESKASVLLQPEGSSHPVPPFLPIPSLSSTIPGASTSDKESSLSCAQHSSQRQSMPHSPPSLSVPFSPSPLVSHCSGSLTAPGSVLSLAPLSPGQGNSEPVTIQGQITSLPLSSPHPSNLMEAGLQVPLSAVVPLAETTTSAPIPPFEAVNSVSPSVIAPSSLSLVPNCTSQPFLSNLPIPSSRLEFPHFAVTPTHGFTESENFHPPLSLSGNSLLPAPEVLQQLSTPSVSLRPPSSRVPDNTPGSIYHCSQEGGKESPSSLASSVPISPPPSATFSSSPPPNSLSVSPQVPQHINSLGVVDTNVVVVPGRGISLSAANSNMSVSSAFEPSSRNDQLLHSANTTSLQHGTMTSASGKPNISSVTLGVVPVPSPPTNFSLKTSAVTPSSPTPSSSFPGPPVVVAPPSFSISSISSSVPAAQPSQTQALGTPYNTMIKTKHHHH